MAERRRAASVQAAAPHGIHEIAHVQPLADVFAGVQLTARIQSQAALFDDFGSQGNIGGDDEIAFARVPDNVAIGNVEAAGHDYFDLGAFDLSMDHRFAAWSMDTTGDERYTLRIRDLSTGTELEDRLDEVSNAGVREAIHGLERVEEPRVLSIKIEKAGPVTAGDIQDDNIYEVINKDQLICTLDRKVKFDCEFEVRVGRGFATGDENKRKEQPIGVIAIDSIFSPVKL